MTQSDKTVRDGVMLVASYHFLLAILSFVGSLAIVIFAILPTVNTPSASNTVFLAVVGIAVGLFLAIFYAVTGAGLIQLKNSARMGAVFLALFGTIAGLFVLIGAGIPTINKLLPDMAAVAGVIVGGLCGYALLTVLDLTVLTFLFNKRVRALFYGEPYTPDYKNNSLANRLRSTFIDEVEEEQAQEEVPAKKVQPKPQAKAQPKTQAKAPAKPVTKTQLAKETPVRETPTRRANPPEVLDAPGDLFTEPTVRK
ncbi:MAG: hypothetical protein CVU42_14620 [Chloroflexi bacterium HGW-Chloroflexi-4]|jgi:hypothetical protein|nr:MAG: hypothetical protein CVU42_14620 [Chloroflexi bacterium HGW-Chloroflexi-4]